MNKLILVLLTALFGFNACAAGPKISRGVIDGLEKGGHENVDLISKKLPKISPKDLRKNKIVGTLIKKHLEIYHYKHAEVDDKVSKHAFTKFLERVDYGKQFLLQSDIDQLKQFELQMDDQLNSGDPKLLNLTIKLLRKRITQIEKFQTELFKKPFDFTKDESLELDSDKRKFLTNPKELKDHWRKSFKHSVVNRYLSLVDEQNEEDKDKKKKKKKKKKKEKKKKKLTDQQMRDKAHEAIAKKYHRFFERLLKDEYDDYLEKFINSITTVFDPHTTYLPPKKKEDFDIDISGSLEGIGAVLTEDGAFIKVVKIVPGGAAWRKKELEVDDLILGVSQGDGELVDLEDMRVDDAVRYIRGKKGTEVRLRIKKVDKTVKTISIIRDVVQIGASFTKSSILQIKGSKEKIGYILVPKFYRDFGNGQERNCSDDVAKELASLQKKKVKGIILDLRNNGGGALEDARKMSGLFIKKGPIVQVRDFSGKTEILKDTDETIAYDGPLVVMINRFSASASEILAGALQDYGRAIIVGGEFSHGKGTVQAVVSLNQGPLLSLFGPTMGALKITIQKFYRVTGDSTQYTGVTPQLVLPDPFSYAKNREKDLDFSLPWDKINSLDYSTWTKSKFDLGLLKKRSLARIKQNKRFAKTIESVAYLKKRRNETMVTLNLTKMQKENKENKEMIKKLKLDDLSKDLLVTNYEKSLMSADKIRKSDRAKWKQEFKERKKEWVESLQKDVGLEETMHIIGDMIHLANGKKLIGLINGR